MSIPFLVSALDTGVSAPVGTNRPTGYVGSATNITYAYDNPMAPPDTTTYASIFSALNTTKTVTYTGMPISGGAGTLNVAATITTELIGSSISSAEIFYSKDNGATWLSLWAGDSGATTDHLTPLTVAITGATSPTILVRITTHSTRTGTYPAFDIATATANVYDIWMS